MKLLMHICCAPCANLPIDVLRADVRVTDTHEANGEIVHYCERALDVGSNVEGRIDSTMLR